MEPNTTAEPSSTETTTAAPAPAPADFAPIAPSIPAKVDVALAAWESAAVETLGPMLSSDASNAFTLLRANLRAAIAAALS